MKKIILLTSLFALFCTSVIAETLDCAVDDKFGSTDIVVKYNIKIHMISSRTKTHLLMAQDSRTNTFTPVSKQRIGISRIVWNESKSFAFVQTQEGNSKQSLIGFYVDGNYPASIRVDYWKEDMPIYIHETLIRSSNILTGNCTPEKNTG